MSDRVELTTPEDWIAQLYVLDRLLVYLYASAQSANDPAELEAARQGMVKGLEAFMVPDDISSIHNASQTNAFVSKSSELIDQFFGDVHRTLEKAGKS